MTTKDTIEGAGMKTLAKTLLALTHEGNCKHCLELKALLDKKDIEG